MSIRARFLFEIWTLELLWSFDLGAWDFPRADAGAYLLADVRRPLPGGFSCRQTRPGAEFQLTKITKNFVSTPQFTYTGAQQYPADARDRWLEIEVQFASAPDFTDELTFKYFVLLNGKLLTGEVTHTNVAAGRENRSVMYASPRTLARFLGRNALSPNSVQNIAVQILQKGVLKDELSLSRTAGQWYAAVPALNGFLLNKNETPFAPLYWDRYEQIKPR